MRRREEVDAHAPIDMLVECHRLEILISDREIRYCASRLASQLVLLYTLQQKQAG